MTTITVRDVSKDTAQVLRACAEAEGTSVQQLLLREVRKPGVNSEEWVRRVRERVEAADTHLTVEEIVAGIREDRERVH